jgi:Holliday junction resolvasome RuvABC DNA-binding subunit
MKSTRLDNRAPAPSTLRRPAFSSTKPNLVARHADGSMYGSVASPVAAERFSDAFRALRQMGFKETETRRRIEKARTHVGRDARTEDVIRAALRAA